MGFMTTITKFATTGSRATIPAKIAKQSRVLPGDMLIWTYVPGRDVFELEIRRMPHDEKEQVSQ